jgi:hypothetical protein
MVYADLFVQTKTALQRALQVRCCVPWADLGRQEEDDARKLLEQALQLQISDMMDAVKVHAVGAALC